MADNSVDLAAPTGTAAADDIGGVLYQRIKLGWGPDGTFNEVAAAAGKAVPFTMYSSSGTEASLLSTVSHGATDAGDPLKMGFKATASLAGATLVTAGQRSDGFAGLDGVQITRPHCNLEDIIDPLPVAITDGSSTSIVASAGAGVRNYITTVIIANTSATAVTVNLRDAAAGAVKATFPVPANTSGVVCNLPVPLRFSAATAVCAHPSAAATSIIVTLMGFKSKV